MKRQFYKFGDSQIIKDYQEKKEQGKNPKTYYVLEWE